MRYHPVVGAGCAAWSFAMTKQHAAARGAAPSTGGALTRREALALCGGAAVSMLLGGCSRDKPQPETKAGVYDGPAHYLSLQAVARLIETRSVSPVQLTQQLLDRIGTLDPSLHGYATVTTERALELARRAEREIAAGDYRGPLHGVPLAVKDLCYTRGVRTMGGLAVLRDFVPDHDATVIARLEAAGAVLLGKLNLTEGAMAGYHPDFQIPVNPWRADAWSGASSSGSGVAVAAGLCFAALGTDTGGSIRFPSMASGIVGLKPTYGRVSRHGVLALAESMDHVGPMTRRVADAALVLQAMAGHDPQDPTSLEEPVPDMLADLEAGVAGLRIGYDRAFVAEGTNPGLVVAIEQALEVLRQQGATIVEVAMPADSSGLRNIWYPMCAYEAAKAHAANFPSRADEYGPAFRDFLAGGAAVTDEQYAAAMRQREDFNGRFNALLESVDAVVCPSGGHPFSVAGVDMHGDTEALGPLFAQAQMQFTIPANFAGTPTLTLPCGFSTDDGLPHAMQFMGRRLSEPMLLRIGHAYESATAWHERHPPV
jgi:amidase